jgi:type IV secretion system protein VirB9
MITRLTSLAVLASLSMAAGARQIPVAGREDTRMRTIAYNPAQVVRLSTAAGAAMVVSFSPDEKVTAVAVTDSKDLIVSPRDNFLFLKSKIALPQQPVIVLTSGPSGVRRYVFDIKTLESTRLAPGNPDVYYSVQFTYPEDERAKRQQIALDLEAARAHHLMDAATENPLSGTQNWRYVADGDRSLLPLEVVDNGFSTAFRFPGNTRVPAIFRIDPDGQEAAVNYSIKGDYVIVGTVAAGWRLRDGNTVLCIWNRAYDKIGTQPGTNTTSPMVERITRSSPK